MRQIGHAMILTTPPGRHLRPRTVSALSIPTQSLWRADLPRASVEWGHLSEAIAGPTARARHLHALGKHRIAIENEASALWRAALAGRTTAAECNSLISKTDRHGMELTLRTSLAAKAVCLVGDGPAVTAILGEAAAIARSRSGTPGWREWSVALLHALRLEDRRRIGAVRDDWKAAAHRRSSNYRFVDRLFVYAGYPPTYPPLPEQVETADADQRWQAIIAAIVEGA
ncbi:hypothetical protein [Micromonospora sp. NPDC047134]|uniref:hypothetical protein n=1 Tax=Micromonospora sp. NPDC047134 TaxID=3154340 RepID=UPI0033C40D20